MNDDNIESRKNSLALIFFLNLQGMLAQKQQIRKKALLIFPALFKVNIYIYIFIIILFEKYFFFMK